MRIRHSALSVSLAILAGCGQDAPTATQTVQLAVVAGAEHGGAPFSPSLRQEVTTVPVWAGDPDGTGSALITINVGQGQLCWETSVSDISLPASASHIHQAVEGIRGDIVVFLSPPDGTGRAVGCRLGIDPTLLRQILERPTTFYVNVHTSDFPAGAIRGQLGR